jgi:DNA repair protein RecO (recombination protein O)
MINAQAKYCLDPAYGIYLAQADVPVNFQFSGQHIQAIAARDFTVPEVKQTAKRITRILLKPLLGSKPLMSRELFS